MTSRRRFFEPLTPVHVARTSATLCLGSTARGKVTALSALGVN